MATIVLEDSDPGLTAAKLRTFAANDRPASVLGRNRVHYRTACGCIIYTGLGVDTRAFPNADLCRHCFPERGESS